MSEGRECEVKFRIASREDYLELRDSERWGTRGQAIRQVNHYFDTSDLDLARRRMLLRIREAETCVLTLKCGEEVSPGNFDSLEIEAPVTRQFLERALAHPASLLDEDLPAVRELSSRLGRPGLVLAGTLVNERVRRDVAGWTLELDRLTFPDGSESYELEVEVEMNEVAALRDWVDRELVARGLRLEPERRTKFERLLDWYRANEASRGGGTTHGCD